MCRRVTVLRLYPRYKTNVTILKALQMAENVNQETTSSNSASAKVPSGVTHFGDAMFSSPEKHHVLLCIMARGAHTRGRRQFLSSMIDDYVKAVALLQEL